MRGVVENGTGYKVKALGRPAAGKTGTSNDQMDAWFIGYTPDWVCGVWSGFDLKRPIGKGETGGMVSAPTWLYFMKDFLEQGDKNIFSELVQTSQQEAKRLDIQYTEPEVVSTSEFIPPHGVKPYWVYKASGQVASAGVPGAIKEYFIDGTGPAKSTEEIASDTKTDYWNAPDL